MDIFLPDGPATIVQNIIFAPLKSFDVYCTVRTVCKHVLSQQEYVQCMQALTYSARVSHVRTPTVTLSPPNRYYWPVHNSSYRKDPLQHFHNSHCFFVLQFSQLLKTKKQDGAEQQQQQQHPTVDGRGGANQP